MNLLQINLNHHWAAQNLMVQNVAERDFSIACVSEPLSVPRTPHWFASRNGTAAIYVGNKDTLRKCVLKETGRNFIMIKCEQFYILSIYLSPNESDVSFYDSLDKLCAIIRDTGGNCVVVGDFNCKSIWWGSPGTDWRGRALERWAAELDLRLVNSGRSPTCVRKKGSSIIDLTWSTADIFNKLRDWCVLSDEESLSDHLYIVFRIGDTRGRMFCRSHYTRWNTKAMDRELFREALSWLFGSSLPADSVEGLSLRITNAVKSALNLSAKKLNFRNNKRGVYWWCDEIQQSRRKLTRCRKRGAPCEDLLNLYKLARSSLCREIKKAKLEAWDKLLQTLEEDPWGLPYKIVMDRLRRSGTTMSQSLEPAAVERLLEELFPSDETHNPEESWRENIELDPIDRVSSEEVKSAIRGRRRGGCPAPGPDGLSLDVWKRVPDCVVEGLGVLYTRCLEEGKIPDSWKRATLVLIPKGVTDVRCPKARPICLLNDIGKFLERILNDRLKVHVYGRPRCQHTIKLSHRFNSGMQFGFREGLSTVDALDAVTGYIREKIEGGKVVLAVGLDIKNAFNSLSWGAIRWALEKKKVPDYLRRILDFYLYNRWIEYPVCTGELRCRRVVRGVPQGSVLGPFLWNIAYDYVLSYSGSGAGTGPPRYSIVGYADDTLVLCTANSVEVAQHNINNYLDKVLRRVEFLSLEVAPEKTEAVLFRGRKRLDYSDPLIRVRGSLVKVQTHMKYLGVILDYRLNFKDHFKYIDKKVGKVNRALGGLMPNLKDPREKKRKLYAHIINATVLYAAPIWAGSLTTDARMLFRRWQRAIAIRVCAAYRSVSFDAATLLARLIPLELLAAERARIFFRQMDARDVGALTKEVINDIRIQERILTQRQWIMLASRPGAAGTRTRKALLPHLPAWINRRWGGLTFRITQMLSGHGCFGNYLHRIGKAEHALCQHCGMEDDTADHTLQICTSWLDERNELIGVIGNDLSLLAVIKAITTDRDSWIAFARFCENVMRAKEDAERQREAAALFPDPFDPG